MMSSNRLGRLVPTSNETELLRAATLPVEQASAAWTRWRRDHELDDASARSRSLLPAVAGHLPPAALGDDAALLQALRRRTWAANQLKFTATGRALEVLSELQPAPIVAKGAALALTAYRHAGDRPMADVDIVVGAERFGQSTELLFANGWRPGADFEHQPFMHACGVLDEGNNEIDVHRWMMFPRLARVPERWCERAVPFEVAGQRCRRYVASDELVLAVTHGLGPHPTSPARWPIDVARLVAGAGGGEHGDGGLVSFWAGVVESAEELALGDRVGAGLAFCARELGVTVPDQVVEQLSHGSTDRVQAFEWTLLRTGVPRPYRTRQFIDTERVAGRRPTVRGYAAMRSEALRRGGGVLSIARRRARKLGQIVGLETARRSSR